MKRSALAAIALLLPGCALFGSLVSKAFEKPKLTFKRADVREVRLSEMTLVVLVDIENPNDIDLSLARADVTAAVEGHRLAAIAPEHGFRVAAQGKTEVPLLAKVRYADVFDTALAYHHQKTAHYQVSGTVGVDTPIGVLDLPVSAEGDVPLPEVPEVKLESAQVTHFGLDGATLALRLTVTNRGALPLKIDGVSGRLMLGETQVGAVQTPDLGELAPGVTLPVEVPLTIQRSSLGDVMAALASGDPRLNLLATLKSGDSEVPLDLGKLLRK